MKYVEEHIGLEVDLVKDESGEYIQFEWRDVVGYEGYYQVSNYGHVKSLQRYVNHFKGNFRLVKVKLLKQSLKKEGYLTVNLSKNNKSFSKYTHRLVVSAFIGKIEPKEVVNHKNHIKTDNRVDNLEICTQMCNIEHSIKSGVFNFKGEDHNLNKLNKKDVIKIKNMVDNNDDIKYIAKLFNVTKETISNIKTGKSWGHVTGINYKKSKDHKVKIVNCRGEVFSSISEATSHYKLKSHSSISNVLKNTAKTGGKYIDGSKIKWYYYNEINKEK